MFDDPAKLFRRLAVFSLFSGEVDWRNCRSISGGGEGNGSSRCSLLFVNGEGGGGKSGLGTRSNGFLGGR